MVEREGKLEVGPRPENVGQLGRYEITAWADAEERAIGIREKVLTDWVKYSGFDRKTLEYLFDTQAWVTNPISPFYSQKRRELDTGKKEFVALSAWDFNGCLSLHRDGYDPQHTFCPELEAAIKMQIERLGSFFIISALTSEQMAYHLAKEKNTAGNIIMASENGRGWLIPSKEGSSIKLMEFKLPLSEKNEKALIHLKEIVNDLTAVMRQEGLVSFVNDQKFSKCTMEGAANGREWYRATIEKLLLPYLAAKGAVWNGNPERFSLDGIGFAVSPTPETWEIEVIEGTDKIGKRLAREILHNTLTDITLSMKEYTYFRLLTGGDSVKWGGSDVGLTDPNAATIPFAVPAAEKDPRLSLDQLKEFIQYQRKYWPTYVKRGEEVKLAGAGIAPADFMKTVIETVPCLFLPTQDFAQFLAARLTEVYGYLPGNEFDLSQPLLLYNFPADVSDEQKELFLKAGKDLPIPADDKEAVARFISLLRQRAGLAAEEI